MHSMSTVTEIETWSCLCKPKLNQPLKSFEIISQNKKWLFCESELCDLMLLDSHVINWFKYYSFTVSIAFLLSCCCASFVPLWRSAWGSLSLPVCLEGSISCSTQKLKAWTRAAGAIVGEYRNAKSSHRWISNLYAFLCPKCKLPFGKTQACAYLRLKA